jgi:outer membrane murein-binding lipoprotein Lpp
MDDLTESEIDPHNEIERLEARIEQLEARIESCRKFVLAARIAIAGGGVVLAALLFGIISFEPTAMAAAFAAVLGGIVVGGSNSSTAKQAKAELTAAEARRSALIGQIDLHLVAGRDTLH